jgi:imidazolonepropionase-like amidohydrolase
MEALAEILEGTRHITCHSYIQSEVNMLLNLADSIGFKINTFTHILEGYKVADKLALHGAGASTFSDWWAYKYEVKEAIPYNASLMQKAGVLTAINSDDGEMGRRLNHEAAKAIKYGDISEEDAWNMVTINPAKLLHIDDRVGSISIGKDADLVLWSGHPLSVYSKAEKTYIEGVCYYDTEEDKYLQEYIKSEKSRIVQKILSKKKK